MTYWQVRDGGSFVIFKRGERGYRCQFSIRAR
jgi:hypothetical protein